VGLALLGIAVLAFALPSVVIYVVYLADGAQGGGWYGNLASLVAQCVIGAALIVGARRISEAITKLRRL